MNKVDRINFLLGDALRIERLKKRMSQSDLAETLGISDVTVSYRESGKRKMNIDDFAEHCKALGIDNWIQFMQLTLEGK